jgi:hypothetical protein
MRFVLADLLHDAKIVDRGEECAPGEACNGFLGKLVGRKPKLINFWRLRGCRSRRRTNPGVIRFLSRETDWWRCSIIGVVVTFAVLK